MDAAHAVATPGHNASQFDDPHLIREWEQAWIHYRHVESTRSQYLGFIFTLHAAIVGLLATLWSDSDSMLVPRLLIGSMFLVTLDTVITTVTLIATHKLAYVKSAYHAIIGYIRRKHHFLSNQELPLKVTDLRGYPDQIRESTQFSVQRTAENSLFVILGMNIIATFALLVALDQSLCPWDVVPRLFTIVLSLAIALPFIVFAMITIHIVQHTRRFLPADQY